ncbi:conserved hypothetical protein, partial [Trichinella spiralis]
MRKTQTKPRTTEAERERQ